jgi:hypothetical protein
MPAIMADNDILGHFRYLLELLNSPTWGELWDGLNFKIETFRSLGLAETAADSLIWQTCQDHEVVLITGNRNDEDEDSLEATIRRSNRTDSLPVITIADPERFRRDRGYAEKTAERVMDYLLYLDDHRGGGRLYVP